MPDKTKSTGLNSYMLVLWLIFAPLLPLMGKLGGLAGLDAFSISLGSVLIAAVVITILMLIFRRSLIPTDETVFAVSIGIGGLSALRTYFYFSGLLFLDTSVLQATSVLEFVLLGLFLEHKTLKLDLQTVITLGVAILGVIFVTTFSRGRINYLGISLVLASGPAFIALIIASQRTLSVYPVETTVFYVLLSNVAIQLLFWYVLSPPVYLDMLMSNAIPLLLLGIATLIFWYVLFFAIKQSGNISHPTVGFITISPLVITLLLSSLVLGDTFTQGQRSGVVILVITFLVPYVLQLFGLGDERNKEHVPIADVNMNITPQNDATETSVSIPDPKIDQPFLFISYSHQDRDYIQRLTQSFDGEGVNYWIDERIDYGSKWPHVIQEKLDQSRGVIIVLTPSAYQSQWVQNELSRAQRKQKLIFPLLLKGDEPWLSLESTQYIDVRDQSLPPTSFFQMLDLHGFISR